MSKKEKKTVYEREYIVLNRAKKALDDDALDAAGLRLEFEKVVSEYKKILRQSDRMVRISDRQQLELIELNDLKNKFVGMVAHDLRSPCGIIFGFSDIMMTEDDMDADEHDEFIDIIHQTSSSMLKMLDDLLDVSAIESGRLTMDPKPGNISILVEQRARLLGMAAGKKNISLCAKTSKLPLVVFDPDRMSQVIDNFITNAIKFSQPGTTIEVSTSFFEGQVVISVKDQGPGITPEDQEKLFGTFQKLSNQPTGGEKSTGLGLAIVKKIVTAHNGKISVESVVGKGTIFSVFLPYTE